MNDPYDNHEHRVLELRRDLANLPDTEGRTHEHLLWDLVRARAENYSVTNDQVARWVHAGMDLQERLRQEEARPAQGSAHSQPLRPAREGPHE